MYNGTGLQSARGSGSNGHIQNNKFSIKPNRNKPIIETKPFNVSKKANIDILDHDRRRRVEVQLVELEEKLIDQGFSEEEVAEKLNVARRKLEDVGGATVAARVSNAQTHQIAARKEKKMEAFKAALGIDRSDSNSDVQEKIKLMRGAQLYKRSKRHGGLVFNFQCNPPDPPPSF